MRTCQCRGRDAPDNEGSGFIQAIAIQRTLINEECPREKKKEGTWGFIEVSKQGSHLQVLWKP